LNHFATPDFWHEYRLLPPEVRDLADKSFQLLKSNPRHPSVRLKKAGILARDCLIPIEKLLLVREGDDQDGDADDGPNGKGKAYTAAASDSRTAANCPADPSFTLRLAMKVAYSFMKILPGGRKSNCSG